MIGAKGLGFRVQCLNLAKPKLNEVRIMSFLFSADMVSEVEFKCDANSGRWDFH